MMQRTAIVLALLATLSGPLAAQDQPSAFTSDHFNLEGALVQAALTLFPQGGGTFLDVTRVHEHYKIHEQTSFEKYEARAAGQKIGEFIRFRSFAQEGTVVDLALKIEDGKIKAAHALQPVLLRGKPFLALPGMLVGLQAHKMSDIAAGLAALFNGLVFLEPAIDQPPVVALDDMKTKILVAWARKNRPPPARGAAFPRLDTVDELGKKFDARKLAGKTTVVLAGVLHMDRDRQAFDWVHQYVKANPGRFNFVELVQSTPENVAQYRKMGGEFPGTVLMDQDLKLHAEFKGAFTPTLYFYDQSAHLIGGMRPVAMSSYDKIAATLDGLK